MRSPAEQHADNERVAQTEGWALGEAYEENGAVSASRYSHKVRPGFGALVADLECGGFGADILLLWENSRGSRKVGEWVRLIEACESAHVAIYVTSQDRMYDPGDGRDRKALLEDAVDSEYESHKISMRAIRSVNSRAAQGEPHGRVPWGYVREYGLNERGKRVIVGQYPDPEKAGIIRGIFGAVAKKKTLRAIAAELNAQGLNAPGGQPWTGQNVRDLCLNPAYAGLRLHVAGRRSGHDRSKHGTLIDGTWAGIVTKEQWHDVHDLLTDPRRRTSRPGRDKHLLSMIGTCDVCGGLLTVRYKRGRGEYSCRDAGHVRIGQDELDQLIARAAFKVLSDESEYRHVTRRDNSAHVQAARDELASAEAHHRTMLELVKAGKLSLLAFADLRAGGTGPQTTGRRAGDGTHHAGRPADVARGSNWGHPAAVGGPDHRGPT